MQLTAETLAAIAGQRVNDNMRSMVMGLQMAGVGAGLNRPHRLAHYLAQTSHESMGWVYDREIWGPTPAQKRYEGRTDLGNTQPGDGSRFRGRGGIQITGRANYSGFTLWAQARSNDAPNFVEDPDAVNSDPWEGLGPIWYWDAGNPTGESLNAYADANNAEMITRRINGGLNGYPDRLARYGTAEQNRELADSAVVESEKQVARLVAYVAGLNPEIVLAFQAQAQGQSPAN